MKHLYLVLLILAFLSAKTQNWQAVYSDRVQYFDSGINAIKIVSKKIDSNGDSIFHNYPSLYLDNNYRPTSSRFDSTSWIGKAVIIKPNGINGFIHTLNDTCVIKTNAGDKESWDFVRNDSTLIIARIDSISYGTYNGISDSVKHISLSVIKVPKKYDVFFNFLNNKQIWLSKHNGLLLFPVIEFNMLIGYNDYYLNAKPVYNQTKVNLFTNKNMFDFEVGDVIHSEEYSNYLFTGASVYNGWSKRFSIDKYIDKQYDTVGDSVQFKISRRNYFLMHYNKPDTTYVRSDVTFIVTQTFRNLSQQAFGIMPNSLSPTITSSFYAVSGEKVPTEFYKYKSNMPNPCDYSLSILQQENYFEQWFSLRYTSKQGFASLYQDASNGAFPSNPYTIRNSIVYSKNSCGDRGADVTLFVSPFEKKDLQIVVYPNPANNNVSISASNIIAISLTDISGKKIDLSYTTSNDISTFDVSVLPAGVYFCEVVTEKGKTTHKLLVQH